MESEIQDDLHSQAVGLHEWCWASILVPGAVEHIPNGNQADAGSTPKRRRLRRVALWIKKGQVISYIVL